ncbi:MAG: hypothetical protein V5B78_03895, partial [Desulfohalobiaceae bacterium]
YRRSYLFEIQASKRISAPGNSHACSLSFKNNNQSQKNASLSEPRKAVQGSFPRKPHMLKTGASTIR